VKLAEIRRAAFATLSFSCAFITAVVAFIITKRIAFYAIITAVIALLISVKDVVAAVRNIF
jgi:uncharacterized membrane protein